VHLADPDNAGHSHGWMSAEYLEAVCRADRAVGSIVETLRKAGTWERTALLVTSDHGGHDRAHFTEGTKRRVEDLTIPWICVAPGVRAGVTIERTVRITDSAPTALAFLGLKMAGVIDGICVEEMLRK
jgi:arylsulfatase A-like enzyme